MRHLQRKTTSQDCQDWPAYYDNLNQCLEEKNGLPEPTDDQSCQINLTVDSFAIPTLITLVIILSMIVAVMCGWQFLAARYRYRIQLFVSQVFPRWFSQPISPITTPTPNRHYCETIIDNQHYERITPPIYEVVTPPEQHRPIMPPPMAPNQNRQRELALINDQSVSMANLPDQPPAYVMPAPTLTPIEEEEEVVVFAEPITTTTSTPINGQQVELEDLGNTPIVQLEAPVEIKEEMKGVPNVPQNPLDPKEDVKPETNNTVALPLEPYRDNAITLNATNETTANETQIQADDSLVNPEQPADNSALNRDVASLMAQMDMARLSEDDQDDDPHDFATRRLGLRNLPRKNYAENYSADFDDSEYDK